ncbi:MAG TPA: MerC family mercury resistance protein [Sandaracinaceae bacterium LLY-WYZ-13_1]|nr:MerC family mercury resistance protein [Sandaracinaceae bacterium LLY-WYZ-13_1]
MSSHHADHGHACDCPAHRGGDHAERGGWWGLLAPVLVCLVCPACLSTYAKVLAALGVGVSLTNEQHGWLLAVAVAVSLVVSGWRSWRARRVWPIAVAVVGGGLLLAGHLAHQHALEWVGIAVLLVGGLVEQQVFRHRSRRAGVVRSLPVSDASGG